MSKEIFDIKMELIGREVYSDTLFLGRFAPVDSNTQLPKFRPGQFVQVWVKGCDGVMLRRPISIYDITDNHLYLLVQSAGRATSLMSQSPIGTQYDILLPLGNSFTLPQSGDRPLLIGGGVGVAPLHALGKAMSEMGIAPTFLLGARSKKHFANLSHFEGLGELFVTTEDASLGEKGFVTDHSILSSGSFTYIYMCGPTPMMKAVARWAKANGIPAEASLENHMACGLGVCLCCVEPTLKGHQTVCHDGPVFDINQLLWE